MKVEVLLATMFFEKETPDFLDIMNVQTDIMIGNQTNYTKDENYEHRGCNVKVLSRNERGVGLNRNTCLFNSDADIVIFADNDVSYYDGYGEKVKEYYKKNPDADVVIFNYKAHRVDEPVRDINTKNKKASMRDTTKFGTYAITAKREALLKKRIAFSLLFGGGAKYSCGEDTLFLMDSHKKGLKMYLCDQTLGEVTHKESTWYKGITEKYLYDKGAIFKAMNPKLSTPLIVLHAIKNRKLYEHLGNVKKVLKVMLNGAREYKMTRVVEK